MIWQGEIPANFKDGVLKINMKEGIEVALITCPECGKDVSEKAEICPHCGYVIESPKNTEQEKIAMPISMIIVACMSFVLSALFLNQSIAVLRLFAISGIKDAGGLIGILMALLWILSGIIALCFRKAEDEIGSIFCFALCLFSAFVGIMFKTGYDDLKIWTVIIFLYSFLYFAISVSIKLKINKRR